MVGRWQECEVWIVDTKTGKTIFIGTSSVSKHDDGSIRSSIVDVENHKQYHIKVSPNAK